MEYDLLQPTTDPPLLWDEWRVQYKLDLLAKENSILGTVLGPKPEIVELSLETTNEETIVGSSAQSEWEPNARNAQQNMNCQNIFQRIVEIDITRYNRVGRRLGRLRIERQSPFSF